MRRPPVRLPERAPPISVVGPRCGAALGVLGRERGSMIIPARAGIRFRGFVGQDTAEGFDEATGDGHPLVVRAKVRVGLLLETFAPDDCG
jgi:hypothetical protein